MRRMLQHIYGIDEKVTCIHSALDLYELATDTETPSLASFATKSVRAILESYLNCSNGFAETIAVVYARGYDADHPVRQVVGRVCGENIFSLTQRDAFRQELIHRTELRYDLIMPLMVEDNGQLLLDMAALSMATNDSGWDMQQKSMSQCGDEACTYCKSREEMLADGVSQCSDFDEFDDYDCLAESSLYD